jgi:hypothetical protein
VDSRGRPSCGLAQGLPIQSSSPHGSLQKGAATALPHCYYSRGQYCHRHRAARRRPRLSSPATSILRQRGPVGIEGTVPASTEATVCNAHHLVEATTLLLAVLDHRRHRLPARRHLSEPRCYWKNLQMGSRTRRPHHRLQAMNNHQVAGTSRLNGGVAGESATNSNRATIALCDVLRWLTQAQGRGCRGTPDLSNRQTTQVRPTNLLKGLKQQSRVRSSTTRALSRCITRH